LGLFGGTFDPPHAGHLAVGLTALHNLSLDVVDLLVANEPWQKTDVRVVTPAEVRLEMTRALIEGHPGLRVDDREIRRGGITYTVDTLIDIAATQPNTSVFLIMGADAARRLPTWHRHTDVLSLSTLVIVNRAGTDLFDPTTLPGATIVNITMEPVLVSSTDIRDAVRRGENIDGATTTPVANLIHRHGLYKVAA
jgi:nicotinate-nucleotide adenylyltransferase